LNDNFKVKSATHLAAFSLWRLSWIHPFFEANGRTARAFCYLVMCVKYGVWLSVEETIHVKVRKTMEGYYDALQAADKAFLEREVVDLTDLEEYLRNVIFAQFGRV
jgi:Fic family protein